MNAVANIDRINTRLAVASDRMITAVSGARTTTMAYSTIMQEQRVEQIATPVPTARLGVKLLPDSPVTAGANMVASFAGPYHSGASVPMIIARAAL